MIPTMDPGFRRDDGNHWLLLPEQIADLLYIVHLQAKLCLKNEQWGSNQRFEPASEIQTRNKFPSWIPAYAGMTTMLYNSFMDWDNSLINKLGYWFTHQVPSSYLRLMVNVPLAILEVFGLKVHLQYFFDPMFHDASPMGRVLSVFFRVCILVNGTALWLLSILFVWLIIPLVLIMPVLGIFWHVSWWFVWLIVLAILLTWRLMNRDLPWGRLDDTYDRDEVLRSLPERLSVLVAGYPRNQIAWWQEPLIQFWLARLGIREPVLDNYFQTNTTSDQLCRQIFRLTREADSYYPEIGEVMLALYQTDDQFKQLIKNLHIEPEVLQETTQWLRREIEWFRHYPLWDERYQLKELAGYNLALTGTPTPILNHFSVDLTRNASALPFAVGREDIRRQVLQILSRQGNEHVMIVGETGSGKTTFVGGLAQAIMIGGAPVQIANKRVVKLEPGRLVAGAKTQGEVAQRLVACLEEIKRSGDIILFIDEIHTLLTSEDVSGGFNMFNVLEEALSDRQMQMIAATSISNYKKYLEPYEAFTRLFETVKLEEPGDEEALLILENVASLLEAKHGVIISLPAIQTAIQLSRRYIRNQVLPNKAKSLLDQAGVEIKATTKVVQPEDVAKVVTHLAGVPVTALGTSERQKLLNLESELHKQFVDQELAVKAVADALRRARLDIKEQQRPIGSFMFVGPTGVGKTELARRLAEVYFGSESAMIRFDMSEFSNADMLRRLVGAAPGEPGYGEGGELTEKVRRQGASLILLDEIEKAHPKVWDLLLQIFDEGRLSDAAGLTVDFTNTIIITTSNAVTTFITQQLADGKSLSDLQRDIFEELLKTFRIELLNRYDGIIPFGPLGEKELAEIVKLQLVLLKKRLKEKRLLVEFTPELVKSLAAYGLDPRLGARPLKRLIQDKLESHLARVLLEREEDKEMKVVLDEKVLE